MNGVQGLGRVGGGDPGLSSRLDTLGMQINPENVLGARRELLAEADRLEREFKWRQDRALVRLCGGDPVSRDAMLAFNERIDAFLAGYRAYYGSLRAAADRLAVTAREYGIAEARIEASARDLRERL